MCRVFCTVRGLRAGGESPGPYLGTADLFFAFFQGAAQHGASGALPSSPLMRFIPSRPVIYPTTPSRRTAYCLS